MGMDTNTGPVGGDAASWKARRSTGPRSAVRWTSCAHFTRPDAMPVRLPDRNGSASR